MSASRHIRSGAGLGQSARSRPSIEYDLSKVDIKAPELPGEVMTAETVDDVIDLLAADLVVHAENCVREFGDFHLALSGGNSPVPLYRRLMYDPNYRRLPWRRTHLWLVDERCVDFDSPQSNFRMIDELVVDHSDIPRAQVHPMYATSKQGDTDYERELQEVLAWREKGQDRLDFALLGMGADGHTASLFPHSEILKEQTRLVCFTEHGQVDPPRRLSMTLPMLNASRFVAVLVTGRKKASAVKRLASGDASIDDLPVCGLDPHNGELHWYLDAEACGHETEPSDRLKNT